MASFVRITHGEVHGESKRRDDYTASRCASTMYCSVALSFNVLPAQRVSFNVLPTQSIYPWYCISDGFVLPQDNQSSTDTQWVLMFHQHRFIILDRSLSWTQWIIRQDDCNNTTTNSWPLPPLMLNDVTPTWDNDDSNNGGDDGRGGFIVDRNDEDDGGVKLGIGHWQRAERRRRPSSRSDLA